MNPFLPNDAPFLPRTQWELPAYRLQFSDWDEASWVRSKPFRDCDLSGSFSYYPRKLVPYFEHPVIAGVDDVTQERLLAHHLARWCAFTLWVEDDLVVQAAADLTLDLDLPVADSARREAHLLRIDEAAHSAFTQILETAVVKAAGLERSELEHSTALEYRASQAVVGDDLTTLTRVAWSTATETLISGELGRAARDASVFPAISGVILDHAQDEAGTHAPFFVQILRGVWPNLTADGQRFYAAEVASALRAYLAIDERWLAQTLDKLSITQEPLAVAHDICTSPEQLAAVRRGAHSTIRLLKGLGAFNDPALVERFRALGLVD